MIETLLAHGFVELDLRTLRFGAKGVYVLFGRHGEVIYVGQGNVGCRVRQHNYRGSRTKRKRAVAYFTAGSRDLALEAELIRLLKPKRNVSRGAFLRRSNHPVVGALVQPSLFGESRAAS